MELMSEIELKLNLYLEGVRIDPSALEGVGDRYKENITYVFDYNYLDDPSLLLPLEMRFPLGTLCRVCYDDRAPYLIRRENGTLFVEKEGRFLSTLEWTERPRFYDCLTSDGQPMKRVAQLQGDCCFTVCFTNYCINWQGGNQCRYCNLNAAQKDEVNKGKVLLSKRPEQVGEAAAERMREAEEKGIDFHGILVAGTLPGTKASEATIKLLDAMRRHTGKEAFEGFLINIAAPLDLSELDHIYAAGGRKIALNLETWDPRTFEVICPGKHLNIGRETFLKALEHAASVFGRGHACSAFVCGLEEKSKYYEAAEYLAERGSWAFLQPWKVMKGSLLEGHRTPGVEWHLEVNERVIEITAQALPEILAPDFYTAGNATCIRCQPLNIFFDLLHARQLAAAGV